MSSFIGVAEKFVEDIIAKATHEVATASGAELPKSTLARQLTIHNPPEIQIDLAGPRSPTPEEETFPWVVKATGSDQVHNEDLDGNLVKGTVDKEIYDEYSSFALEYVNGIIAKATEVAVEKLKDQVVPELTVDKRAIVILDQPTKQTPSAPISETRASLRETTWTTRLTDSLQRLINGVCCRSPPNAEETHV
ncbi:hypothetical protein HDE_02750 [Halotydeus destructor]|nr:hypothetical protein HDE_02750 [Halotydeus destructor]